MKLNDFQKNALVQTATAFKSAHPPKNSKFGYVYCQLVDGEWVACGWRESLDDAKSFCPNVLFVGENEIYKTVGGNDQDGAIDFLRCAEIKDTSTP